LQADVVLEIGIPDRQRCFEKAAQIKGEDLPFLELNLLSGSTRLSSNELFQIANGVCGQTFDADWSSQLVALHRSL
jgi:hypothetical protein